MKAIQVHDFILNFEDDLEGNLKDKILSMNDDVPKPTLSKGQVLVQVHSCSISPGDVMKVHGNMMLMHEAFPFVPGMDVCGIVVDANKSQKFQNGDIVVADNGMAATGGMAEFMAINESEAVALKPSSSVSKIHAAASSSAITARNACMDYIRPKDRVLILGGSGGVGSAAIQIAKHHANASFVATTSSQVEFCKKLGADVVVNYHDENWWEKKEWLKDESKFDIIIDCVGGGNFYGRADKVLKKGNKGGRFIAVTGDDPKPECRTLWRSIKFIFNLPLRPIYTRIRSGTYPKFVLLLPYDQEQSRKQVLEWMEKGTLQIPLDEASPLPFTADGVRKAFQKVASGHAHGKVVVQILQDNEQKQ